VTRPVTRIRTRLDFRQRALENPVVARVVLEHLTKEFPGPAGETIRAVSDLGLTVEDGELLALVGPSGCGKTTTLRLLAGLEEPTAGMIAIGGRPMNGTPPKDRDLAMVFQSPALYPHLSVYDNLAFGLKVRKCGAAEIEQRVKAAAALLGLGDCLARLPMALSGGQRQRVAIGRAVVRRPGLFLWDEPLSNLDLQLRSQMRSELVALHRRLNATTIYVTHDQVEAMLVGDRLAVMRGGVLQQLAGPLEVYRHPANLFVAGFIGSPPMNLIPGRLQALDNALFFVPQQREDRPPTDALRLKLEQPLAGKLAALAGKPVVLGARPEQITASDTLQGLAGQSWHGMVERTETTGAEMFLHVVCEGSLLVVRAGAQERFNSAQPVKVFFDMQRTTFFEPATGQALLKP